MLQQVEGKKEQVYRARRRNVEVDGQLKAREEEWLETEEQNARKYKELALQVQTKEEQLAEARRQLQECNDKMETQRRGKEEVSEARSRLQERNDKMEVQLREKEEQLSEAESKVQEWNVKSGGRIEVETQTDPPSPKSTGTGTTSDSGYESPEGSKADTRAWGRSVRSSTRNSRTRRLRSVEEKRKEKGQLRHHPVGGRSLQRHHHHHRCHHHQQQRLERSSCTRLHSATSQA